MEKRMKLTCVLLINRIINWIQKNYLCKNGMSPFTTFGKLSWNSSFISSRNCSLHFPNAQYNLQQHSSCTSTVLHCIIQGIAFSQKFLISFLRELASFCVHCINWFFPYLSVLFWIIREAKVVIIFFECSDESFGSHQD